MLNVYFVYRLFFDWGCEWVVAKSKKKAARRARKLFEDNVDMLDHCDSGRVERYIVLASCRFEALRLIGYVKPPELDKQQVLGYQSCRIRDSKSMP